MHRDVRKHCARSRHIGVRKYYVRELVVDKLVKLMPCGTKEMVADALTKSLPYPPFRNSQTNARCHIAVGKRLLDVGIAVLKRVEMNRDGGD